MNSITASGERPVVPAGASATGDGPATVIAELRAGSRFEGRFACIRKDRHTARNGSAYLTVVLRDRTGQVSARIFREADRQGLRFAAGDAVAVRGRAELFRGELVAELDEVRRLEPGSYDEAEFLPAAYRSVEELEGFLEHLAREIHDDRLRGVVERIAFAGPAATELRRAPATRGVHHSYIGGLLEHTVAVGTLVVETCQLHPRLDSDLLMAAAILHDIGRTREFTYGAEFGLTDEGRMLGHLTLGAEIIGPAATGLPPDRRLALLHCVLSHHGSEAGQGRAGPQAPATPEAIALQRLNALDAGIKGALETGRSSG